MSLATTLPPARTRPTWWSTPQRVWLRRAIFQVHLWVGLFLTFYVVIIGVSGSALVFRAELENAMDGAALRVTPQPERLPLAPIIQSIQKQHPDLRAAGIEDLDHPEHAWTLLLLPHNATPNYRLVSFNPYTGQVLLDRLRFDGPLGWLANLHFYLLSGELGLAISGYFAIGLLLLCVSGLVLWWPGVRRWTSSLLLHRRSRWQRVNWDLDSVIGFWSSAALLLVTGTGIYFAFPAPVACIVSTLAGDPARVIPPLPSIQHKEQSPPMTVDEALKAARQALPADAPPGYLQLPSEAGAPFQVTGYHANTAPYSQLVELTLNPHTGAVLARIDTRQQPIGQQIIQYSFTLRAGSFAGESPIGPLVKAIWVILGLAPALLGITGALMYWNRSLRGWLSKTQRAR